MNSGVKISGIDGRFGILSDFRELSFFGHCGSCFPFERLDDDVTLKSNVCLFDPCSANGISHYLLNYERRKVGIEGWVWPLLCKWNIPVLNHERRKVGIGGWVCICCWVVGGGEFKKAPTHLNDEHYSNI